METCLVQSDLKTPRVVHFEDSNVHSFMSWTVAVISRGPVYLLYVDSADAVHIRIRRFGNIADFDMSIQSRDEGQ